MTNKMRWSQLLRPIMFCGLSCLKPTKLLEYPTEKQKEMNY